VTRNRTHRTRRQVLRALAASGAVALAGCSGDEGDGPSALPVEGNISTGSGVTSRPRSTHSEYDAVVDVTEEGADPTGEESVTDVVADLADDGTLLEFPAGTYALDPLWLADLEQFGMRGVGDTRPRLVPTAPADQIGGEWLTFRNVGPFEFEWFEFDFTQSGYGGRFHLAGTDDALLGRVTVNGQYPPGVAGFRVEILDGDSTGVVEQVRAIDGAPPRAGSTGLWVGYDHAGELYVVDCEIANFPDNGLYASAPGQSGGRETGKGPVHVRGGEYRNNNIANVRLGAAGSSAKKVSVVATDVPPHDGALNVRGIHLRTGSDHLVEDCEVEFGADAGGGFGGIVVHDEAGGETIRDTTLRIDRDDVPAINVLRPPDPQPGPNVENVTIEGSAAAGGTVVVRNRKGTTLEECTISQSGSDRDGLVLSDVVDGTLSSSHISVTGDPIVSYGSSITRRDVRIAGDDVEPVDGSS